MRNEVDETEDIIENNFFNEIVWDEKDSDEEKDAYEVSENRTEDETGTEAEKEKD